MIQYLLRLVAECLLFGELGLLVCWWKSHLEGSRYVRERLTSYDVQTILGSWFVFNAKEWFFFI